MFSVAQRMNIRDSNNITLNIPIEKMLSFFAGLVSSVDSAVDASIESWLAISWINSGSKTSDIVGFYPAKLKNMIDAAVRNKNENNSKRE